MHSAGKKSFGKPYIPDVISAQNYNPFGSLMPGRQYNNSLYRYGFNGQEKTDEISGTGTHTTALFWEYDARLGRRWNLDPKPQIFISDYSSFGNKPLLFNDVLGDTWKTKKDKGIADEVRKDIGNKISNIDKKIVKLESRKQKLIGEELVALEDQIGMLKEDRSALNDVIVGLDEMEADNEYTYTFASHLETPGTKDGHTKGSDGNPKPGLTTYSGPAGKNYEGKPYSATITLHYWTPKPVQDFAADMRNQITSKAIRAHEIIHGLQIARRMLIPKDLPNSGDIYLHEFDHEAPAYKTQAAYEKH